MYIIVAGGGQVGYYLSKVLVNEGHEVLVIEQDPKKVERINEELGSVVMRGDGCEATTLEQAGTGRADMLIAVTGDDEDNLVACQVAKHKFKVARTIARIKNPENEGIFEKLGIDVTVSATNLILANIERELPTHPLTPLLTLKEAGIEVVEVKIPPGSPVVGKRLGELSLPRESIVSCVIRKEQGAQVCSKDTMLEAEDEVVAVIKAENEGALRDALVGT